jgi:hypothetical protein
MSSSTRVVDCARTLPGITAATANAARRHRGAFVGLVLATPASRFVIIHGAHLPAIPVMIGRINEPRPTLTTQEELIWMHTLRRGREELGRLREAAEPIRIGTLWVGLGQSGP